MTNNRISKTEAALAKKEVANCGRWCEVTMKKNGDVVKIERVGYGPMERPEWDAHKVCVNGIEQFGLEFKNLGQVAAWICENY